MDTSTVLLLALLMMAGGTLHLGRPRRSFGLSGGDGAVLGFGRNDASDRAGAQYPRRQLHDQAVCACRTVQCRAAVAVRDRRNPSGLYRRTWS